jgi:hypothetical protein
MPLLAQTSAPGQAPGSVNGTVVDSTGAVVVGARVQLSRRDGSAKLEAQTDINGQFFFPSVVPGDFDLTVNASGFGAQMISGTANSGQVSELPRITLTIAATTSDVRVSETQEEVAEVQIKEQEKQRVLGVVPNFYVSYVPNAAPLVTRQKYELAWKSVIDPVSFVLVGASAGVEQAANSFGAYGQGAEGYAKRYGAAFADEVSGTFIASAILPSLLKQDPRYFYKGTGSTRSRIDYAVANAVICKGDNGRWQVNYSNILGSLAAGGISNLYYPSQDRNGVTLTFENAGIGIGETAAANIIQEFLVKKLTPHARGSKSNGESGDDPKSTHQ